MMKKLLSIFITCIVCLSINAQSPTPKNINVIFLGGQSNMVGHGSYNDLSQTDKDRVDAVANRVTVSKQVQNNNIFSAPLGINKSYQPTVKITGFGPELFSAIKLAEDNPTEEYLFIKTAWGGSSLYGAWSNNWTAEKAAFIESGSKQTNQFYQWHISHIQNALQKIIDEGNTYTILGMFWMQGENDALKIEAANSYEANLTSFINAYRTTFNLPKMPFIAGQINSRYGVSGGPETIRQAFLNVEAVVNDVKIIRTAVDPTSTWADYPKRDDNVHYNNEGLKRLGIEFANKLVELNSSLSVQNNNADFKKKIHLN